MKTAKLFGIITMCILLIPVLLFGCAGEEQGSEESEHALRESAEHAPGETAEHAAREAGEHAQGEEREHGISHSEEGEESGIRYAMSETCNEVRKGVQLILRYDTSSSAFIGTVKNISNETVKRVRVEVHLSNKAELGPTKQVDLAPGEQVDVNLSAEGHSFEWWSAHAESGSSEH